MLQGVIFLSNIEMPELFDEYNYTGYPFTIAVMIRELKKIIDDYQAKKLTNEEVKIIISFYAKTSPEKLFDDEDPNELNITLKRKIGKFRRIVLKSILKEIGVFQ